MLGFNNLYNSKSQSTKSKTFCISINAQTVSLPYAVLFLNMDLSVNEIQTYWKKPKMYGF